MFFPFSIRTGKCNGSCNNINEPYGKLCVPDVAKILNLKVINLMSWTNETRHIECHKTCKCKCSLDVGVCNNKQRWNNDKCRCKCKEFLDNGVCDEGSIWNPSNCECECEKLYDIGEYLDYENCRSSKILVDKLVEECTENIDEGKLARIALAENENKYKCSSWTLYNVLFSIVFTINVGIGSYFFFFFFHWYVK